MTPLPPTVIKRRGWPTVAEYLHSTWLPDSMPHMSIVAQTRSGKSHLIRHGILPLVQFDRVLIIDSKGDDPTWQGCGRPVKKMPSPLARRLYDEGPRQSWIRLILHGDRAEKRQQAQHALDTAYHEGNWIIVLDELRNITDARHPGLGLVGEVENLWLMGASRKNMVISGTQAPRWVPSSFYTQPSYLWVGAVQDEAAHKRILEAGGLVRADLGFVSKIPRHEWLLVADGGQYIAHTKPPARRREAAPAR